MNALDSMTSTALTDLSNLTNAAAFTSVGVQPSGLQDPLNFNSRTSSSLTVLTDLVLDSIDDTHWLGADTLQPVPDFLSFDQPTWGYQDDLIGLVGTFNQSSTQWFDFATGDAITSRGDSESESKARK